MKPTPIPANPAKAFFVEMITRDIELQDALLDLLDNCVDGVRRAATHSGPTPYKGYFANITFSKNHFSIEDNCGGIPLDIAKKYAFMMGRPLEHKDSKPGQIGVYGIGMKRAIFKMGRSCVVHSHTKQSTFEVRISRQWLDDDKTWDLQAVDAKPLLKAFGTHIAVTDLHEIIAAAFTEGSDFSNMFQGVVRDAYSLLIEKGFKVKVNGVPIESQLPTLLWDKSPDIHALRPYIFRATIDEVKVFVAVGFRDKLADPNQSDDQAKAHYSSENAGWTIVCNDRVVLPYDKTRLTGWGWGGVPSYHNQFIAISGFVALTGDPSRLPMTTTKRGIDANSSLYTTVREKMQRGLLLFTKFTNDWKSSDTSKVFSGAKPISLPEITKFVEKGKIRLRPLKGTTTQHQYAPQLPTKSNEERIKLISFKKPIEEIKALSEHFFESDNRPPAIVGAACFEFALRKIHSI